MLDVIIIGAGPTGGAGGSVRERVSPAPPATLEEEAGEVPVATLTLIVLGLMGAFPPFIG